MRKALMKILTGKKAIDGSHMNEEGTHEVTPW
jgi:hypothetical protein